MTTMAPFGSWKSPITSALLTSSGIGFSEVRFSNGQVYWLESRPDEGGRVVVVRCRPDGAPADLIPPGFNTRTRAHEYGGGAYFIHNNILFFSNFKDQRLYRQDGSGEPRAITPEPPRLGSLRYADGRVTNDGRTIICVRERHEESREAINEIVAMPAEGVGDAVVLLEGYDFYSFPRMSPDGKRLAWTCWRHPQMPWDGTELWAGDLSGSGPSSTVSNARRIAGSTTESIFQPEWAPDGTLHFISDRTGWWNLYREQSAGVMPVFQIDAEIGIPQWLFGYSRYAFLSGGRIACIVGKSALEYLAVADQRRRNIERPVIAHTAFGSITTDGNETVFFAAGSPANAA